MMSNFTTQPFIPYWKQGTSVANLSNATDMQEISGGDTCRLAVNAGHAFFVSDSPSNSINIIRLSDGANRGTITLTGVSTGSPADFEELSSCWIDGQAKWVLGDIGDNPSTRTSFNLVIFPEPTITGSNLTVAPDSIVNCIHPAGNPPTSKDMEAMVFDQFDRKIYCMTKRDATQKLYSLPYATSYSGQQTLTYEGVMTALPASRTVPLTTTDCYAVGATINKFGKEILVKNYYNIYCFQRNPATQTVLQALQQTLPTPLDCYVGGGSASPKKSHPNAEPQGEGLFFDQDSSDFYNFSEYIAAEGSSSTQFPLFKNVRVSRAPTKWSFQNGVLPTAGYAGCVTTYIWGTNPATDRSAETTFVVDTTPGNATDDRRGLLKFDLSSIPTTAKVIGAKLTMRIEAEGQGWIAYRMLVTWAANSTYNSLTGGVTNDGVEAAATESWRNGVNLDTIVNVKMTDNCPIAELQDMITNSSTNFGWLFMGMDVAGGDGVQFAGMSSATAANKPLLEIWTV